MSLIFFASSYLGEGGNLSIRGSDVRVDIFPYNFLILQYFPIFFIQLKILFYRLLFYLIFA